MALQEGNGGDARAAALAAWRTLACSPARLKTPLARAPAASVHTRRMAEVPAHAATFVHEARQSPRGKGAAY